MWDPTNTAVLVDINAYILLCACSVLALYYTYGHISGSVLISVPDLHVARCTGTCSYYSNTAVGLLDLV